MSLDLLLPERQALWKKISDKLESVYGDPYGRKASPPLDIDLIRKNLADFSEKLSPSRAVDHVVEGLEKFTVHTTHPMYYGLFNPRANFASVVADLITAVFNPQMAAWSHAPFAAEVEILLIGTFGKKFGYNENDVDGTFTSGGAEANLTAVLTALNSKFPEYAEHGLRSLPRQPVLYCSHESHHSIVKAARIAGLGTDNIRHFSSQPDSTAFLQQLEQAILDDKLHGREPFMIMATIGSTGTGDIDPVIELSELCTRHGLWLHADAAYGGMAVLSTRHKHLLAGIEKTDSITFDAHKGMSVAMAASLFITRHKEILTRTFRITADYMPKEGAALEIVDPFTHSIQWSRRFIGLKVYLSLLIFGWDGYEQTIDRHFEMGRLLKAKLLENNWIIYNATEFPIVCFGKEHFAGDPAAALRVTNRVVASGMAWVSVYKLNEINTVRACVTNYLTSENDLDNLVTLLNEAEAQ